MAFQDFHHHRVSPQISPIIYWRQWFVFFYALGIFWLLLGNRLTIFILQNGMHATNLICSSMTINMLHCDKSLNCSKFELAYQLECRSVFVAYYFKCNFWNFSGFWKFLEESKGKIVNALIHLYMVKVLSWSYKQTFSTHVSIVVKCISCVGHVNIQVPV